MKAILAMTRKEGDKSIKENLLFDTEKSKKICEVENTFGYAVQELYLSPSGIIFAKNTNRGSLQTVDQEEAKKYIGEHYPEKYIEFFGQVKEA